MSGLNDDLTGRERAKWAVMPLMPNTAIPIEARHVTEFSLFSWEARFCSSVEIVLMRNDFPAPAVLSILI